MFFSVIHTGNLELALTFQESSISVDKLLSINIADGNTGHDGQLWVEKWRLAMY